jgi:hypothetical protein
MIMSDQRRGWSWQSETRSLLSTDAALLGTHPSLLSFPALPAMSSADPAWIPIRVAPVRPADLPQPAARSPSPAPDEAPSPPQAPPQPLSQALSQSPPPILPLAPPSPQSLPLPSSPSSPEPASPIADEITDLPDVDTVSMSDVSLDGAGTELEAASPRQLSMLPLAPLRALGLPAARNDVTLLADIRPGRCGLAVLVQVRACLITTFYRCSFSFLLQV